MNKIIKKIHENIVFVIVVMLAFVMTGIYLSRATANIPQMDYWLYIDKFVDKMFQGGTTFDDFWNGNGVHRSPLLLFLFTCNVRIFGYNSQIGVAFGLLFSIVLSVTLYKEYKYNWMDNTEGFTFNCGIIASIISLYGLNQWEIMTTEYYFTFVIRIFVFFISFFMTNRLLHFKEKYGEYAIELAIFYVLVICISSGAYFLAYSVAIIFSIIFDLIIENEKKKYYKIYIILILGNVIGALIYMRGLSMENSISGNTINIDMIKNCLQGFILMSGTSVIGYANYSMMSIKIVGIITLIIDLSCIFFYFRKKMFVKSYVPMMFGAYVVIFYLETFYGRGMKYDVTYLISSRYTCETILFILADIWIISMLSQKAIEEVKDRHILLKKIGLVVIVLFCCLGLQSNAREMKRAPYIKAAYDKSIGLIKNIDSVDDEDLSVFYYEPSIIRNDVRVMKKYKLGVFKYK